MPENQSQSQQSQSPSEESPRPETPQSISMHENVETWEDCCVCEPEPRWQKLAEEMEEGR